MLFHRHIVLLLMLFLAGGYSSAQLTEKTAKLFRAVQDGDYEGAIDLLESGGQVNVINDRGYSLLNYAMASDDMRWLPLLLGYGAHPDMAGRVEPPLLTAVVRGNYKHVQQLLQYGCDKYAHAGEGNAVYYAARLDKVDCLRLLLDADVPDFVVGMADGNFAIHTAAENGASKALRLLAQRSGRPVQQKNTQGETPLVLAARGGHASAIAVLLEAGANANAVDRFGRSVLHLAVGADSTAAVRALLGAGAVAHRPDHIGQYPIHMAIQNGNFDIVRLLAGKGADLNVPGTDQQRPLALAAEGQHALIARFLLMNGAAPLAAAVPEEWAALMRQKPGEYVPRLRKILAGKGIFAGRPYLSWAICNADPTGAKMLLDIGADPTQRDTDGDLPLHHAVRMGQAGTVRALLKAGADINAKGAAGNTPLHVAASHNRREIVEFLLLEGAVRDQRNGSGLTALMVAAGAYPVLVDSLLRKGADPNVRSNLGETALHLAVRNGLLAAVEALLRAGVDPNTATDGGFTALHIAADAGDLAMLRLLLDWKADPQRRNAGGHTAADLATFKWQFQARKLLQPQ